MNRVSSPPRLIRHVGKIRGYTEKEYESLGKSIPWITVEKDCENQSCTVSFRTKSTRGKDVFELDDIYEQDDELSMIYSREIQTLVLQAFDGLNSSVIALGARGSGKTFTVQGSREKPGLAVLAVSEILSKARESGNSVSISLYKVAQERVYDLLKPDHPEVQVLDDGHGKINLKGLSQVSVKDISQFCNIFFGDDRLHNNKGLMVHIASENCSAVDKKEGKINFVDLSGDDDSRKKSLHALVNVVTAIRANENRVPYRESKLTRILQDSLTSTSRILLLTCLNPLFCQASISLMSLISRPFQSDKQVMTNKKAMSSSTVKKNIDMSAKKSSSIVKGRKLFSEEEMVKPPKQLLSCSKAISSSEIKLEASSIEDNVNGVNLEETGSQSVAELQDSWSPNPQLHHTFSLTSPMDVIKVVGPSHQGDDASPLLSQQMRAISDSLKAVLLETAQREKMAAVNVATLNTLVEPETPRSPRTTTLSNRASDTKGTILRDCLNILNSANK